METVLFGNKIGVEIADRLYTHYLKQEWMYHAMKQCATYKKLLSKIEFLVDYFTNNTRIRE